MYKLNKTNHAMTRMKQRSFSINIVNLIYIYGESRGFLRGVESFYLSRDSMMQIQNDFGSRLYKECEKYRGAYIIVADDGSLITVAHSHRKTIH